MGLPDPFERDEDAIAGTTGFSTRLARFCPCPFGSTVMLYMPLVPMSIAVPGQNGMYCYTWQFIWRMRNVGDFARRGLPYNVSKLAYGAPDGVSPRYVMPAATETFLVQNPEPEDTVPYNYLPQIHNVYPEELAMLAGTVTYPLKPLSALGGLLDMQQGILNPGAMPANPLLATAPSFRTVWTKICGNEMAVLVSKRRYAGRSQKFVTNAPLAWDFTATTGEDENFSKLFGVGDSTPGNTVRYPDLGIYVFWGLAPK